jgi:pyrroline-5-carboxylate reductase
MSQEISSSIIAVIGPGVMAEAIIGGLLRTGLTKPEAILASGPRQERGEELKSRYGIQVTTDNAAAARQADVVILSVKPQRLSKVLAGLRGQVKPGSLVLSIVAGASIQTISDGLEHQAIARAMPNTPGQIGQGISVWTVSRTVNETQRELARQVLLALGQEVFMEEENYLDMATALSGSGPSYVFLFMEAMIDAGVHMGFPRRISEQLVVQTLLGSVAYYQKRKIHPATLRNEVTSPGGTSAEALYFLDKAGFRTAISRAIWAAYERSQELGKDKNGKLPEKERTN